MYYFNSDNSAVTLDNVGVDLADMTAARAEAVSTLADILRDGNLGTLLGGKPWRVWVTDQPGSKGDTLFAVQVTATGAGGPR
jgi:hypothetical protein